jgi:4-alpha-glucanotransferase
MQLSPDHPIAGILAPLFAIRSADDLGVGDTQSLREFVDWAADYGFGLVQLLPVNETGGDNSPYMAVSSLALEPSTIRTSPEAIPDLSPGAFDKITGAVNLKKLRTGSVKYSGVKPLKLALLASAFASFSKKHLAKNSARARKFRAFLKEQSAWIQDYALFRVLMDENGSEQWDRWPAGQSNAKAARLWLKSLKPAKRRAFGERMKFYTYVQWIAFTQWSELKAYCDGKNVALMGDVPFGVSYYSADVFSNPELFDLTWSGGAPPERIFKSDPFTEKWGQNWGVPVYRWDVMRADHFAWWRQRVQTVRAMFHLFRIDHILGFYRIYSFPWRPQENGTYLPLSEDEAKARTGGRLPGFLANDDNTWENREANRCQGDEVLRVLSHEVGEHRLIGEDLGVVPEYVRPNLTALGIAGFKIPMWEKEPDTRLISAKNYQRLSVTTYATHDHPPLKALWESLCEAVETRNDGHARWEMQCLADFAGLHVPIPSPYTPEVHEGLLAALFLGNSWLPICMITDLFGGTQRFNVPGAVADTNWSERLAQTVAQWRKNKETCALMERMHGLLKSTGRAL